MTIKNIKQVNLILEICLETLHKMEETPSHIKCADRFYLANCKDAETFQGLAIDLLDRANIQKKAQKRKSFELCQILTELIGRLEFHKNYSGLKEFLDILKEDQ